MKVCSVCDRCFDDVEFYCSEAGHPPLENTRRGGPEMIGGYRLDALLSSGLKGDAYRAHHIASRRSCLIRIPSTDEKSREAFLRDAEFAASIFHPNLADIYEVGSLETGECYVVAEDPPGRSLRHLLADVGVPSLLTSIQVVRQAAEAVHALHLKGLAHGALCPENMILTSDAEHRLLVRIQNPDFGGAGQNAIIFNKFFIDSAVDSIRYFAPEQCSGEPAGHKADVYSLGVILYEMLAGTPPFEEPTAVALIEKHKNQRPPDIRIDNFDLRMLLTHTLMESLSKRPERRQSSANAFARQMRHIEQLATHVSTPPPVVAVSPSVRPSVSAPAVRRVAASEETPPAANAIHAETGNVYRDIELTPPPPVGLEKEQVAQPVFVEEMPPHRERELSAFEDPGKTCGPVPEPIEILPEPIAVIAEPAKNVPEEPAPSRLKLHRRKLHSRIIAEDGGANITKPLARDEADPNTLVRSGVAGPAEVPRLRDHPNPEPAPAKPVKIDWKQPEDDLPSMEEVQAALLGEGITVPAAAETFLAREETTVPAAPEPVILSESIAVPATPEPVMPRERISVPIVQESVPVVAPAPRPKPKASAPNAAKGGARPAVTAKAAASVMAAAGPAQRGREVALKATRATSRETVFFPTILGNVEKSGVFIPDSGGEILSAYNSDSAARFSLPNRGLMIGGGVLLFVALVLFGSDSIQRLASIETSGDSVAAKSAPATTAKPDTVQAENIPVTISSASLPESREAETKPPARIAAKGPAVRSSEPRRAEVRENESKPQKSAAPVRDSRETKQNTIPGGKASRTIPGKVAGATRPRIVKVAEP